MFINVQMYKKTPKIKIIWKNIERHKIMGNCCISYEFKSKTWNSTRNSTRK